MIVKVDIPPKDLWALTERAEREGITVGALLLAAATAPKPLPQPPPGALPSVTYGADPTDIRIGALHSVGLTDGQIGEALSFSRSFVIKRRKNLKLPANSRGGGDTRSTKYKAARAAETRTS